MLFYMNFNISVVCIHVVVPVWRTCYAVHNTHTLPLSIYTLQVSYEAGSRSQRLGPLYMNALDNELIQTLHRAATDLQPEQPIIVELVFHILDEWDTAYAAAVDREGSRWLVGRLWSSSGRTCFVSTLLLWGCSAEGLGILSNRTRGGFTNAPTIIRDIHIFYYSLFLPIADRTTQRVTEGVYMTWEREHKYRTIYTYNIIVLLLKYIYSSNKYNIISNNTKPTNNYMTI